MRGNVNTCVHTFFHSVHTYFLVNYVYIYSHINFRFIYSVDWKTCILAYASPLLALTIQHQLFLYRSGPAILLFKSRALRICCTSRQRRAKSVAGALLAGCAGRFQSSHRVTVVATIQFQPNAQGCGRPIYL